MSDVNVRCSCLKIWYRKDKFARDRAAIQSSMMRVITIVFKVLLFSLTRSSHKTFLTRARPQSKSLLNFLDSTLFKMLVNIITEFNMAYHRSRKDLCLVFVTIFCCYFDTGPFLSPQYRPALKNVFQTRNMHSSPLQAVFFKIGIYVETFPTRVKIRCL